MSYLNFFMNFCNLVLTFSKIFIFFCTKMAEQKERGALRGHGSNRRLPSLQKRAASCSYRYFAGNHCSSKNLATLSIAIEAFFIGNIWKTCHIPSLTCKRQGTFARFIA